MSKMKKCKACSKEIATNAKSCPGCGAKNKKPIYKRVWFWVVAAIIVVGAASGSDTDNTKEINSGNVESTQEVSQDKAEDNIPTEYKSALRKAKIYANDMNMSKAGVYDQLTSEYGEKFTAEAAQYAVDNVESDWKENALKKAEFYQEHMAMSPSAIYDQLVSEYGEQFTAEEAQYAVDNLNQ